MSITESNHILSEQREGVLILRFDREDKKNALTLAMYTRLVAELKRAQEDPQIRAVLFAGSSTCFTSGNDVMDFMQNPPTGEESPVFQFLLTLVSFPKPVIASVCGAAVGIGTTMLLHCDLVYAGDNATLSMPFVSLGLCPEAASSLLLPQLIGHQRASELLLLGRKLKSERAMELGFVNAVHPREEVFGVALEAALEVAAQPPSAVRLTKSLLKMHQLRSTRETISLEGEHFLQRLSSPEATEAFSAFFEKRKPDFSSFS